MFRDYLMGIDTVRLRGVLRGAAKRCAEVALRAAAAAAGARLLDVCIIPSGVRAIVCAPRRETVRIVARRFVAHAASAIQPRGAVTFSPIVRVAALSDRTIRGARALLAATRAHEEFAMASPAVSTKHTKNARSLVPLVRSTESAADAGFGADEIARRVRHYVADHDAPGDDAAAFSRLCVVIFAQGLGFETVHGKLAALTAAFEGFDPRIVASFDDARVDALATAPIIRNAAKIRACVENARRWSALAGGGTYLGRVAEIAARDDASGGWPALRAQLAEDFVRVGAPAASQILKRWGFFTALAHPGARRLLERLGFVDASAEPASVQRLLGAVAQKLGRDPYALEAVLAIYAGAGPCRATPCCRECALADRCPSAQD